ncbi:MAG TPA: lipopolysaccharide biosynthesis protein [Xanthobacteraceae bacterium]|nr:lipopolysaccharide biosynthesis protein [Xanthobacteraceae bacterium]
MALTQSEQARRKSARRFGPTRSLALLRAWWSDAGHSALAQRVAGTAFLIRVASAAIAYLSQILLARWMGAHEFGIYVYVWTWVLLIGGLFDLGQAQGSQRFIPEYSERGRADLLRGFLAGSRWLAFAVATGAAVVAALAILLATPVLEHYLVLPLFLACLCLPVYAFTGVQEGIGRSYNWLHLGMAPPYILRPLLLLLFMAGAYSLGMPLDAASAMLAAVGACWLTAVVQLVTLDRRLAKTVPAGAKAYEVRTWLKVSIPIFLVESFYLLLTYTDILVLKQFHAPQEIAVYHAAAKTLALVAFVSFSVSAAVAHRFTEYHVSGNRERLAEFLAESIRWTFWPSLAGAAVILALGQPLLWLFGPDFLRGYSFMFVLAVGLLARAAIGPVERLLNMLGEQNICAAVYALAFALNLAGCLLLVPRYGGLGAAIATSTALVVESILLFAVTKRRLGLHVFIWRRSGREGA